MRVIGATERKGIIVFSEVINPYYKWERGCCYHEGQGEAHLQFRKSSRTHSGSTKSNYKTQ